MQDFSYVTGIYNITPTPFHPDSSLDLASLKTLTDFNVVKGVNGMTILGVLGETSKVHEDERDLIIDGVLKANDGRISICVGTSHDDTTEGCLIRSKRAQELGAKAVMIAPPKFMKADQEAIRGHYLTIADAVDIPIIVQDHPTSTGVTMTVETIARIAEEAPICNFLKLEDEPSPTKVGFVRKVCPDMVIFGGLGGMMFLEELRHGATGTMTGFAFPEILVEIHRKWTAGDIDGATETFYHYVPLIRFENQKGINLALRKHIYAKRGAIASPTLRKPFMPVDDLTLDDLNDILTRLNMLESD
ncbi:dihydrodipicolinate synthase family protein [bacterium]|nr:dihydrodipicolinate synthase family protein [bacterium]